MNRKDCYLAPVFNLYSFKSGMSVAYRTYNRKGVIKREGEGIISTFYETVIYVRDNKDDTLVVDITAKDVYNGKSHLVII